jgi:hypothetical protein
MDENFHDKWEEFSPQIRLRLAKLNMVLEDLEVQKQLLQNGRHDTFLKSVGFWI